MSDFQTPRRPRGRPRTRPEKERVKDGKGRPNILPVPGESAADFLLAKPSTLRAIRLVESGIGIDGRATDGTARTALHVVAQAGLPEACRILVAAGADPNARDALDRTAADVAATPAVVSALTLSPEDDEERERGRVRVALMRDSSVLPLPSLREAWAAWRAVSEKNENKKGE